MLDAVFVYGIAGRTRRLDNPFGALAGGLVLGVGPSYVSGYVGSELTTLAALAILIAVLSLRPAGLFSRATVRKV